MSIVSQDDDSEETWGTLPPAEIIPYAVMLEEFETVNVLAPLVRCSKLPFRHLTSLYETHVTHTPMMLAQEFSRSQKARTSDFTTSKEERGVFWMEPRRTCREEQAADDLDQPGPSRRRDTSGHSRLPHTLQPSTPNSRLVRGCLIAQFASPNAASLADAAELISPYVDGLDLNCGCPQKWAYNEGIGCALLRKPELVADMVRCVKGRMGWEFPASVKIRIDPDLRLTEQLVQTAIKAGVSHITIHGRTRHQASSEPANLDGIKFAVECAKGEVPCVGNGDIWTSEDCLRMRETGVRGVMAARGLLANPGLFAGYDKTPTHAVEQFMALSIDYGLIFPLFQKHMAYMLESTFTRADRVWFNQLPSTVAGIDYMLGRGMDFQGKRGTIWDARRGRTSTLIHQLWSAVPGQRSTFISHDTANETASDVFGLNDAGMRFISCKPSIRLACLPSTAAQPSSGWGTASMDPEIEQLAEKIVRAYRNTPNDQRLLIAVAGAPGSGKSTLAYPLTAHLNAILQHQPEGQYITDEGTGLTSPAPAQAELARESGLDVAICVGLDGWHHTRAELDGFDDPAEAHWRRVSWLPLFVGLAGVLTKKGAAFTFNLASYLTFLQHLRLPLISPAPLGIPFPTFDHALKDPAPSPTPILPQHRIVIIEGLYTMLDKPGWRECAEMMDMRVWVETDREVCRRRLIKRNFEAGVVDDLEACERRVDASDMVNGEQVQQYRYRITDIVHPSDLPRLS